MGGLVAREMAEKLKL